MVLVLSEDETLVRLGRYYPDLPFRSLKSATPVQILTAFNALILKIDGGLNFCFSTVNERTHQRFLASMDALNLKASAPSLAALVRIDKSALQLAFNALLDKIEQSRDPKPRPQDVAQSFLEVLGNTNQRSPPKRSRRASMAVGGGTTLGKISGSRRTSLMLTGTLKNMASSRRTSMAMRRTSTAFKSATLPTDTALLNPVTLKKASHIDNKFSKENNDSTVPCVEQLFDDEHDPFETKTMLISTPVLPSRSKPTRPTSSLSALPITSSNALIADNAEESDAFITKALLARTPCNVGRNSKVVLQECLPPEVIQLMDSLPKEHIVPRAVNFSPVPPRSATVTLLSDDDDVPIRAMAALRLNAKKAISLKGSSANECAQTDGDKADSRLIDENFDRSATKESRAPKKPTSETTSGRDTKLAGKSSKENRDPIPEDEDRKKSGRKTKSTRESRRLAREQRLKELESTPVKTGSAELKLMIDTMQNDLTALKERYDSLAVDDVDGSIVIRDGRLRRISAYISKWKDRRSS
uniref:Uncharacterized protein n=1 Tax=Spongospora subterranea TaxID=70186 RepID=A0A0H5R8J2_9EUKA|eukprot:CRZ10037.1 hypothetical protein [Spongospora subterranea]